jgi:tetratricopeptide (TPR) repeat protein
VGAIKREPLRPGPIADLFARLDDLHSQAGRPSMREIAKRAGRGNVSSSTVHNIFRSSRVPRWGFLKQVVEALGTDNDRQEFLTLWQAAWRAENEAGTPGQGSTSAMMSPQGRSGGQYSGLERRPIDATVRGVTRDSAEITPRQSERVLGAEIPRPNDNFTGRMFELELMRSNLDSGHSPRVQVVVGMGGIGKTELVTEYIHHNIDKYEIIWWIRAEHHDRVRDALVKLAQRLGLRQATTDGSRDRTITAVLQELQSEARSSWLMVYDNAINPLDLQKYLPASRLGGHVIITSRQLNWPSYIVVDGIELSPFTEDEAISFLRHKVRGLALSDGRTQLTNEEDARRASEARQLAAELGHLPIAIDHAAAYLAETDQSVDEYLIRFAENAHQLLSEQPGDSDPPAHISGTWAMSTTLLTQDAEHLFNLCAFFSPEPIAAELFLQDTAGIDDPPGLAEFLSSPHRFRAAASLLHRLSLAKVDGARDLIQMHRVVQAVTKGRLQQDRADMFYAYRAAVDQLLAMSNPGSPEHSSGDVTYDLSLQHLESDHSFLHTDNTALRALIIDQVRRLRLRGAHVEALQFGQDALEEWRERLGEDDLQVLTMAVEVAIAMYIGGRAADAHELILQIRPSLERYTDGDGFKVFLLCENFYGEDLRARSQFREALELDLSILPKFVSAFGVDHERTLNVRNNIAVDYLRLGRFRDALEADQRNLEDRRRILGPNDLATLTSYDAVARDLRSLGLYQESLDIARKVVNAFEAIGGRENLYWLDACDGFATALRKSGYHWDALQESEYVLHRYRDYLGADHVHTLRAAANLVNARRAVGDLISSEDLARETHELCLRSSCPEDLLYAVLVNLASVLRVVDRPDDALFYDEQARRGLIRIYGDLHPFTLAANINYAADLAALGKLGEAIQVGHETLAKCCRSLGESHPDTLMTGANLAVDEAAAGNDADAELRLADVLRRYEETLTLEHPEARAAANWTRLTAEIEPYI